MLTEMHYLAKRGERCPDCRYASLKPTDVILLVNVMGMMCVAVEKVCGRCGYSNSITVVLFEAENAVKGQK